MLSSPKKTIISFVSPNAQNKNLTNTNETHPALFTMYRGKGRVQEYNLGTSKYLVSRMALPKLLSYA